MHATGTWLPTHQRHPQYIIHNANAGMATFLKY